MCLLSFGMVVNCISFLTACSFPDEVGESELGGLRVWGFY